MTLRMLCTDCLYVGAPDTLLPGSDRTELVAWGCLGLPGLVYCGWRHLHREKRCALCGSGELMRESRASAAQRPLQAEPSDGARIVPTGTRLAWPRPLASPRDRLRAGAGAALALAFGLVAGLLGLLELAPPDRALRAAAAGWLLGASCAGWQAQQLVRRHPRLLACQAWDEQGRRLQIEQV